MMSAIENANETATASANMTRKENEIKSARGSARKNGKRRNPSLRNLVPLALELGLVTGSSLAAASEEVVAPNRLRKHALHLQSIILIGRRILF
jgi:hypothetical protein